MTIYLIGGMMQQCITVTLSCQTGRNPGTHMQLTQTHSLTARLYSKELQARRAFARQTSRHTHAEIACYHKPLLSTFACTIIFLHFNYVLYPFIHTITVFATDAEAQQSSSPLDLIKQLRQKLAVHLPKPQQMSRLHKGCLLLSVAAAQGSEDTLPPATHCTTEAELAQQVCTCTSCSILNLHVSQ